MNVFLSVSNNNLPVLEYFKDFFKVGYIIKRNRIPNHLPSYDYRIGNRNDKIKILEILLPFLKVKYKVASLVLQFLQNRKPHYPYSEEELNNIKIIRTLNSRKRGIEYEPK